MMSSPTTRSFDKPDDRPVPQIADFVSAVRDQLNDLSADEVAELTGGLEADLTDALAEAGSSPSDRYGDPVEYASELRAAAGLPPRGAGGVRREPGPGFAAGVEQGVVVPLREVYESGLRRLDARPWWPGVRDFLLVLRPAWWMIRAWIAVESLFRITGVGNSVVRGGFGGLVLLLAVIVVSVQAGRHTPLPSTWQRVTVAAWNTVATALLLPMMFVSVGNNSNYYDNDGQSYGSPPGLNLGGEPVTNVFPYDAEGRPLTGVQLYDQEGRPLETEEGNRTFYDEQTGTEATLVPGSAAGQAPRWNAFPLQQRITDPATGVQGPAQPAPQPLTGVPPSAPTGSPSTATTPSPSGSPTSSGSPAPSESPSRGGELPKATPTETR